MKIFVGCYSPIHKCVRAMGLFLFVLILFFLLYGIWFIQPNSVESMWYWFGVLILLIIWAGLAFWEILLIRRHFLVRNEKDLENFLVFVQEQQQKLNLGQTSPRESPPKE